MGVLQAVETLKLIVQGKLTPDEMERESGAISPASMLLFSANSPQPFRSVRLRSRRPGCVACSKDSGLSLEGLKTGSLDYAVFCGLAASANVLKPEERIQAKEYDELKTKEHLLVDVREKVQFDICNLEGSINIPFSTLQGKNLAEVNILPKSLTENSPIYVVCRLGNDSQVITRKLKEAGLDNNGKRDIRDIRGGFKSWKREVDPHWPEY
jgi:adenylyltransferase/sulfurtransferase